MQTFNPVQGNVLLHSQQLYFLITDATGNVLQLNDVAKTIDKKKFSATTTIEAVYNRQLPVTSITLHHFVENKIVSINWEVHSYREEDQKFFNWIAPVIPASAVNPSTRFNLEDEKYKTFIEYSSEGIFCQEFSKPFLASASAEELFHHLKNFGFISECNPAMAKMYGYSQSSELKGMSINKLIDFSDPFNLNFIQLFKENNFQLTDAESHEKDRFGQSRYFLNNLVGIVEDGCLIRVWGTQRDITEKKKAEEKALFLSSLVEQTSDIFTAADLNFIPISWNKAAEETYGLFAHEVIGKNLRDFLDISYPNTTREEVRKIINRNGEWRGDMVFKRIKDGKLITLLATFKLLKDGYGKPLGYIISGTDITARKEAELRLKESENRFKEVADSAPVSIWMMNADNELEYVNKTLSNFIGAKNGLTHEILQSSIHPDDAHKILKKIKESRQNKISATLIYRLKNWEGEYRWVQDTGLPRFLHNGSFIGFIGSIVEIHDTKEKEEQLQYQATILENVRDVIVTTDINFNIKSWNKVAEKYYGATKDEVIGKPLENFVQFNFLDTTKEKSIADLQQTGVWNGEVSYTNNFGEEFFFNHSVKFMHNGEGEKIGIMSVGQDITGKHKAEEKLKDSELFYRNLIADSLDGMLLMDASGIITFVSPSIKHTLGFEVDEVLGRTAFDFVHPDDQLWALESFQKEIQENPDVKFIVVRLLKKNGDWLWCMVRGHNLLGNPYINSIVIYFHDDTMRKNAMDALKESELRFRKIVQNIQFGVVMQDNTGKVIMCNNETLKILSLKHEKELIGKMIDETVDVVLTENGVAAFRDNLPIERIIATKKPVKNLVLGIKPKSIKEQKWILVSADPVLDQNNNIIHIICTLTDITERKKFEKKLLLEQINQQKLLTQASIDGQEKERLEIGKELHDNIGQQLTTTKLFLELARSTADDETNEMVNMAIKSVSDVINDIRGISRSLVPHTLGDLGLIDSVSDLIETILRTQSLLMDIDYSEFDEDEVPENQRLMLFRIIQEQLNNIVKHADAKTVHITLKNNDEFLSLEIKDDGKGFDIKKVKKGLGLINIKNRAELFGGKMELIASPGAGCTLKIQIPNSLQELA